jgi:hypothetical protein
MTCSPNRTTATASPVMRNESRPPVAELTARQLDRYGNQLTRCLKALGTEAPIRADIQHELTAVRTEQDHRAGPAAGA